MSDPIEQIKYLLRGIDATEIDSNDGWWETSTGAVQGAIKLAGVLEIVGNLRAELTAANAEIERLRQSILDEITSAIAEGGE